MSEWRPINEAPKDGTPVLAYVPETKSTPFPDDPLLPAEIVVLAFDPVHWWHNPDWRAIYLDAPTHFMPLPSPPEDEKREPNKFERRARELEEAVRDEPLAEYYRREIRDAREDT